jgi:hypothetical protein
MRYGLRNTRDAYDLRSMGKVGTHDDQFQRRHHFFRRRLHPVAGGNARLTRERKPSRVIPRNAATRDPDSASVVTVEFAIPRCARDDGEDTLK